MGLDTNFNTSPYFDDYDETKRYHRILFKPRMAVQARELTQLQTILQNQIERFGSSIYKNGSIVDGCAITFRNNLDFVRLKDQYSGNTTYIDTALFANCIIESVNSGLQGRVISVNSGNEAAYPDTDRLYIQYLNSGSNSGIEIKTFANNEVLKVYTVPRSANVFVGTAGNTAGGLSIVTFANSTANTFTTGKAYGVGVGQGIIYQKGHFIRVEPSILVVNDSANNVGNTIVGFQTTETLVNSDQDTSLLDNALGYPNYTAPGADRLKLTANLIAVSTNSYANTIDFTPIVQFNNGTPVAKNEDSAYSRIGDELARRQEETNGSYIVKPFNVDTKTHSTNTQLMSAIVSPGVGYALGHRIELIAAASTDVRRGTDTAVGAAQLVTTSYGQYVLVNEVAGTFDFTNVETVDIYNTAQQSLTNRNFNGAAVTGTKVGTANMRAFTYVSGTPGTPTAQYALYLYNIVMTSGNTFATNAKSFYFNGSTKGFADIVTVGGVASLQNAERRKMIWNFGKKGVRRLTDASNNVNLQYTVRTKTTGTLATTGLISLTLPASHAGGTDRFPFSTGVLSDGNEAGFVVTILANTQTSNATGTVTGTSGQTNATGSGTSFNTQFSVGEYVKLGTDIRRVTAITNSTLMTVDAAWGSTWTSNGIAKYYSAGYEVPLLDTMVGTRTINITANTTATINVGAGVIGATNGAVSVAVYHDVLRTAAVAAKKTINKNLYLKIDTANNAANNTGPWILGVPDIHKIRNIFVGSTYANTNTDMLSSFYLDTGQRDTHYDVAKLYLKPGNTLAANQKLFICYDAFTPNTTGGVGFFSVASYPIDDANTANTLAIQTSEIPVYVSESGDAFPLRDCVDFRPYVANTTALVANGDPANTSMTINPVAPAVTAWTIDAQGVYVPSPDKNLQTDVDFYLGRKDLVYFTPAGVIKVKEGIPSEYPIAPEQPSDGMSVAILDIKPYPSLTSNEQEAVTAVNRNVKTITRDSTYPTQVSVITNRRYTMRDIGVLDGRIKNLEYYMALSLLEKSATDLQVADTNGLNRFKNGIFVDPFTSHINGDVSNPEYKIAVDSSIGVARPYFTQEPVELEVDTLTNVTQTSRFLTLPFNSVDFINQPRASKYRNAAPLAFKWAGNAILYPNYNHNIDKVADAAVQVTVDLSQTWSQMANSPWGTSYGQWRTTSTTTSSSSTETNLGSGIQTTTTVTSTTNIARDIQKLNVNLTETNYNLGTYIEDITIQPYMASVEIAFSARAMRPSTKVYAFFDNVNVSQYCAPGTVNSSITDTSSDRIVQRTAAWGTQLTTDSNGVIYGKFVIPAGTFRVGERRFRLADVTDLTQGESAVTTSASATFVASNYTARTQSLTLTTITPEISVTNTTEAQSITSSETTTNFVPVPSMESIRSNDIQEGGKQGGGDPIAQGFRVETPTNVAGAFISKIDTYFKAKTQDTSRGVTVYICEMLNGYPNTSKILASKWMPAANVSVSDTAATATTFVFDNPVYLSKNLEYAFIIKPDGNDPDYLVWCAELGQFDITSPTVQIFSQPYTSTMYVSATFTTWTAVQSEYIKFKMYRADFTQTSGTALFRNEAHDWFTINTLTNANSSVSMRVGDVLYKAINSTAGAVNTSVFGTVYYIDTVKGRVEVENSTGNFSTGLIQIHRPATGNGAANSTTMVASANIASIDNIRTNAVVPRVATITPPGTKIKYSYKGTNTSYGKDSAFLDLTPETETELFDYERLVASYTNEVNNMASVKSLNIQTTLTSDTSWLSPLIDINRSNILSVGNLIDTTSANVYLEYFNAGGVQTKYISKPVILAAGQDAEDIKVYITAYRPAGSNILMYAKLLSGDDPTSISDKSWTLMNIDNGSVYSDYRDVSDYVEYSFSMPNTAPDGSTVLNYQNNIVPTTTAYLGANSVIYKDSTGASFARFKTFQLKMVLVSDTTARVPRVNDIRCVALQY